MRGRRCRARRDKLRIRRNRVAAEIGRLRQRIALAESTCMNVLGEFHVRELVLLKKNCSVPAGRIFERERRRRLLRELHDCAHRRVDAGLGLIVEDLLKAPRDDRAHRRRIADDQQHRVARARSAT